MRCTSAADALNGIGCAGGRADQCGPIWACRQAWETCSGEQGSRSRRAGRRFQCFV